MHTAALATALVFAVVSLVHGGAEPPSPSVEQAENSAQGGTSAETIVLKGGNRLEGQIVKRTRKEIFLDVGYTILTVPLEEVAKIVPPATATGAKPPAESRPSEAAADVRQESIFYTANLEPGTIEEKAREVGESVVRVLCTQGSGSGFVIDDKEGYVVTNYHVIERERQISVVIYIRGKQGLRKVTKDNVRIVAFNPFFDLALLKIDDRSDVKLRKAYLGEYSRVRVGDPVFAIGNPLGLERTVSEGIVSSRNRALSGVLAIQTTAPINPGNSGGPLFNDRGEVIGVTSSGYLFADNLGFAIPVHYVKDFLRNREAFSFDKDSPNTGVRYLRPPPKRRPPEETGIEKAQKSGGVDAGKKNRKQKADDPPSRL